MVPTHPRPPKLTTVTARSALLATMFALAFSCATLASANESLVALQSLQGLRSVAEAGISHQEYERRVLDAKIVVDRYLTTARPADRDLKEAIRLALVVYLAAADAWRRGLTGEGGTKYGEEAGWLCPKVPEFVLAGMKAMKAELEQGRLPPGKSLEAFRVLVRQTVPLYWSCAAEKVAIAERLSAGRPAK